MSEESLKPTKSRSPLLAGVLSLFAPGVGQVYCGRLTRGVVFMTIALTATPIYFLILTRVSPPLTGALLAVFAAYLLTCLIPLVDAVWWAQRTRRDFRPKDYNRVLVYILLWWISAGASLGFALHARSTSIEAFRVPAASMYPTILPHDRLLANKIVYREADPLRGDIVVFTPLFRRQQRWIKRIIALAGDTVEIKKGHVFVNDKAFERKALPDWTLAALATRYPGGPLKGKLIEGSAFEENNGRVSYTVLYTDHQASDTKSNFPKTTIPPHHCFVLGDNRDQSRDSRHHGPIPLATIIGRADYLYWPVKSWSRFGPLRLAEE